MRNYQTPAFYKRHYELFARLIAEVTEDIKEGKEAPEHIIYKAIYDAMKYEGSSFDSSRFDAAIVKHGRILRGEE